jgi:hypothetical protein
MKKIAALLLTAVMMLTFSSCASTELELKNRIIVEAIGIDYCDIGVRVTVQFLNADQSSNPNNGEYVSTDINLDKSSREKNCPELILAFKFIYYLFILSILSSRLPSLRHPNLNIVSLTEPGVNGEIDEVYGTLYGFIAQIFTSKTPKPRTMP